MTHKDSRPQSLFFLDLLQKEEFRKALLLSINCVAAGFGATG